MTGLTIPSGVTNIGDSAFYACASLLQIRVPDSVINIGNSAFALCQRLTNCTLGSGMRSIGVNAFNSCSNLPTVTLAAAVTNIGRYAFALCSALGPVYFAGNAPAVDYTAFYADDNATIYHTLGASGWNSTLLGFPIGLWDPQVPCTLNTNNGSIQIVQYIGTNGSVTVPSQIAGLTLRISEVGPSRMTAR